MTTREFVANLFDNAETTERMTIAQAKEDLANFRREGWEIPEGMTSEIYADIWNSFCDLCFTKSWKVYGAEGHRQRESFNPSVRYDFSDSEGIRIIEVLNADKTGTNEYSIVTITMKTEWNCDCELNGQISDGIFENSRVGKVEVISATFTTCEL